MAQLMNEIEWGDPILPRVHNPEWEAEVKADIGQLPDLMTRVAPIPWIRQAALKWPRIPVREFPTHLGDIGALVVAQENACRYCYGVARSYMRLFGHSEKKISRIEREMQLAELDSKDRIFIRFSRNLARSNPRPPIAERMKLMEMGFSDLAVREMAFHIANHCFINRLVTFVSSPPMHNLERLADSFFGRIMRPMIARKIRSMEWMGTDRISTNTSSYGGVAQALKGLPQASILQDILDDAFASDILSKELKILMFAVVARSLECQFCQSESRRMASTLGFSDDEFDTALSSLTSPRLPVHEQSILAWTRETVNYQTGPIQQRLRALAQEMEPEVLLEAIGVAALANSVVRLGVLLDS